MKPTSNRAFKCSLCDQSNEEDTLLMTQILIETFPNFKYWTLEDSDSKLKDMFKATNFRKLLDTILGEKHRINKLCKHKKFEKQLNEFIKEYKMKLPKKVKEFKHNSTYDEINLKAMKQINRILKRKWKSEVQRKSCIYEIEYEFGLLNKRCLKDDFFMDPMSKKGSKKKKKDMISLSTTKETDQFKVLKKDKKSLPKSAVKILKEWFLENIKNPYPK